MRDRERAVHADLEHRARHVILLAWKGLLAPFALLDERAGDRKSEMLREIRRSADRENRAALLEEASQLRYRFRHRHAAHPRAPLSGHGRGVQRAATAAAAPRLRSIALGNRAVDEDDDVVFRA